MKRYLQTLLSYSETKEREKFISLSDAESARSYTKTPSPTPITVPRFSAPEVPTQRAIWPPADNDLEEDEDDAYEILVNVYFEEYALVEGETQLHSSMDQKKCDALLGLTPIAKGLSKEVFIVRHLFCLYNPYANYLMEQMMCQHNGTAERSYVVKKYMNPELWFGENVLLGISHEGGRMCHCYFYSDAFKSQAARLNVSLPIGELVHFNHSHTDVYHQQT